MARVPALSGSLAVVLDRFPELPGRDEFLAALGRAGVALAGAHPLLLALVIEAAVRTRSDASTLTALSAVARDRAYRRDEYDALRRVAGAVARIDPARGAELGARYAALCAEAFAPAVPLGWPIRSAGRRLRLIVLLPAAAIDAATRGALAKIAALPRDAFDIAIATMGRASAEVMDVARGVAPAVAELPMPSDARSARRSRHATSTCCSISPAPLPRPFSRSVLHARSTHLRRSPSPTRPSLVDRVFDDDDALIAALVAQQAGHDGSRDCALDAAALDALWNDAVRAHQRGDAAAAHAAYSRLLDRAARVCDRRTICAESSRATPAILRPPAPILPRRSPQRPTTSMHASRRRVPRPPRTTRSRPSRCARKGSRAHRTASACGARWDWRSLRCASGAEAAAAFERALALAPDDGETHYNHGVALQMQRSFTEAARAYQRALAFKPCSSTPTTTSACCFSSRVRSTRRSALTKRC